jgi:drug/metabolite transporter (DMT)-like permease
MSDLARRPPFLAALRPSPAAGATLLVMLSALVPLFGRLLAEAGLASPTIAFLRFAFSLLVMLPFLPRRRAKLKPAALLAGAGVAMGLAWTAYLDSLQTVSVAAAGIVYMTYPLFAVLLARLLLGQRLGRRALLASGLVLAAALAALSPGSLPAGQLPALLSALPAPIAFALVIVVLTGLTHGLTTLEKMAAGMAGATLGLLPLALLRGDLLDLPADPEVWLLVAGMIGATALLPQLLYTFAAPRVGPSRSAMAGSLELPTMFLVGALAFGERLGAGEMAAAVLICLSVAVAPVVVAPAIVAQPKIPPAG